MKPPLPGDASPFAFGDDPNDHRPRDPSSFYLLGTVLFIASLAMLFGASMIGYLQSLPDHVDLQLPAALWLSTFVLLGSGVTIQLAANAARRDDQPGKDPAITGALAIFEWSRCFADGESPQPSRFPPLGADDAYYSASLLLMTTMALDERAQPQF